MKSRDKIWYVLIFLLTITFLRTWIANLQLHALVQQNWSVSAHLKESKTLQKIEEKPQYCYSSILPKRIYTVLGLESSGTKFVTDLIKDGLNLTEYRNGHFQYNGRENENADVQVQHFSLPFGLYCSSFFARMHGVPVLDVVLPPQCIRSIHQMHPDKETTSADECCFSLAEDAYGYKPKGKSFKYPERYNLDIVSHKEYYDAHGVDQWIIIVLRDSDISIASRKDSGHCKDMKTLKEEEEVGKASIIDAINKFILGKDDKKLTRENYKFWNKEMMDNTRRRLDSTEENPVSSAILSGNNVLVVSFESMVLLGDTYIELLYKTLGIDTDHKPVIKNANSKYVKETARTNRKNGPRGNHREIKRGKTSIPRNQLGMQKLDELPPKIQDTKKRVWHNMEPSNIVHQN